MNFDINKYPYKCFSRRVSYFFFYVGINSSETCSRAQCIFCLYTTCYAWLIKLFKLNLYRWNDFTIQAISKKSIIRFAMLIETVYLFRSNYTYYIVNNLIRTAENVTPMLDIFFFLIRSNTHKLASSQVHTNYNTTGH